MNAPDTQRAARTRRSERRSLRPTHVRGRRFWALMIAIVPILVLVGVVGWWSLGGEPALWIGGALALALGLVLILPRILFEVDDGDP